jgi:hypothetical protein
MAVWILQTSYGQVWSMVVVSEVTSFNSCVSNMFWHCSLCGHSLFWCFISMYFSKCFYIQFQAQSFCELICNTHRRHCLPIAASLVACHFITSSQTFRLAHIITGVRGGAVGWGTALQNQKVVGSIPDGAIGIFHWHNPSSCTLALGLTQPLTEMSTRNISWGVKAAGA